MKKRKKVLVVIITYNDEVFIINVIKKKNCFFQLFNQKWIPSFIINKLSNKQLDLYLKKNGFIKNISELS